MLQVKNKGPAYNFFGIPQPFDIFMTQIALDYGSHFTESQAAAARLAEDASGGYHGIDPEALPEPEQGAAGQGGMGKEGMPGGAPQGTESLEFPSAANTQASGASRAEGGPSLLNRTMGNDSAITGDEDGSKKSTAAPRPLLTAFPGIG